MKSVGIISNGEKDIGRVKAEEISAWLRSQGLSVKIDDEPESDIYKTSDFLIILGGDGTLLRASRKAAIYNIPLLGINLGTLGYLTDVEGIEAYVALRNVLDGNYKLDRRMMLCVTGLEISSTSEDEHIALNDFCLIRSVVLRTVAIELKINGEYIDTYRSDGIIVSTPTGSTAYSLSAGGPVLKPDSEMIVVTPICPHMTYARPIVISASDTVDIRLVNSTDRGLLTMDGQKLKDINSTEIIRVRRSEYYTTIIKTNNLGFFDILRCKMGAVK